MSLSEFSNEKSIIWVTFAIIKGSIVANVDEEIETVSRFVQDYLDPVCDHEGVVMPPSNIFNYSIACHQLEVHKARGLNVVCKFHVT